MERLDRVYLCLRHDHALISQARVLFDTYIKHMPEINEQVEEGCKVVERVDFESALVKI